MSVLTEERKGRILGHGAWNVLALTNIANTSYLDVCRQVWKAIALVEPGRSLSMTTSTDKKQTLWHGRMHQVIRWASQP